MSSRSGSRDDKPVNSDTGNGSGINVYNSSLLTLAASSPSYQRTRNIESSSPANQSSARRDTCMDFFSAEIFQIVLHNPTTSHRLLKFCQNRACAENIEFLQKVDRYNRLLEDVSKIMSEIHSTYTSVEAPRQINVPDPLIKGMTTAIKHASRFTIPGMETIFSSAQVHVEELLESDIYPRFVKHQVTTSATIALADDKARFEGLGDCFCLTDPSIADNPIVFASDGFVDVTGYSRRDIIPRNCRFLQGDMTDKLCVERLRNSIDNGEETVELLLNYRKNGEPFWNLLYVSPLLAENGNVEYFLGGQINCSTTIHSCTDILRILSLNDDGVAERGHDQRDMFGAPSVRSKATSVKWTRSSFFKSFRIQKANWLKLSPRPEAGMERDLINQIGRLDFPTQVEAFYTAYSKYLVLKRSPKDMHLTVSFYSPRVIDMLCLNEPNGDIAPIYNKEIFKILAEHSSSSSTFRSLELTVRESMRKGNAVSIDIGLMTGMETKRGGFNVAGDRRPTRVEEKYISHWTPLKDEEGRVGWVVLTIAPKLDRVTGLGLPLDTKPGRTG